MTATVDTALGLDLLDVIQLKAVGRFSGSISVKGEGDSGLLFFRDGQVIHAETGRATGEEAFFQLVQGPNASFALQPNVTTTRHTIHRSWQFLLLESQRQLDEARRHDPSRAPVVSERRVDLVERLRRTEGVAWAALEAKTGPTPPAPGQPVDPLGEQTAQLGALAQVAGERFGIGELVGATVQGSERNLLLMATKAHHLLILVEGGAQAAATESEIRRILAARR